MNPIYEKCIRVFSLMCETILFKTSIIFIKELEIPIGLILSSCPLSFVSLFRQNNLVISKGMHLVFKY